MIVNKATGMVLATSPSGAIQEQTPAAPSNGDWMVPANQGQLWRISAADITQPQQNSTVGGTVASTLSLAIGSAPSFGTFTPALAADYDTSTTADVLSTASSATLSVADSSATPTGHLVNGVYSLPQPLQVSATSPAGAGSPLAPLGSTALTLLTYSNPVSHDPVTIHFRQHINSTDPLRTGAYSATLTFTLSTTTPGGIATGRLPRAGGPWRRFSAGERARPRWAAGGKLSVPRESALMRVRSAGRRAPDTMMLTALLTLTPRARPEADAPADAGDRPGGPRLHLGPRLHSVWAVLDRVRKLEFPRRFPILQFPNLPLIIAFLAGEAGRFVHGTGLDYTRSVAYVATAIWAYEELAHGVNWFRHLLGFAYVIIVVVRIAHAVQA